MYVGNTPADKYISMAVQHFTTSATTSYTLDHAVTNENEIRLVINNVVQQPGSSYAYTASGTALTLSAATTSSDTMYCVFLGKAVQTVTPTLPIANFSSTGIDDNASSTAVTIDSSNRLLVGKTSAGTSTVGAEMRNTGLVTGTVDGSHCSNFNRLSSDGEVIRIQRGGTTVGKIEASSSGISIYLGGTGSANALDDFEEGTFTPSLEGTSGSAGSVAYSDRVGYYVKIGKIVHIQLRMVMSNLGSWGGNMYVSGLPFTVANEGAPPPMSLEIRKVTLGNYGVFAALSDGSTNLYLKEYISANDPARITISDLASNSVWIVNGTYRTTA